MNSSPFTDAVHVLTVGIWVGELVFITAVVSPQPKRMGWTPAERIAVRSAVGCRSPKVAGANGAVLFLAAIAD